MVFAEKEKNNKSLFHSLKKSCETGDYSP